MPLEQPKVRPPHKTEGVHTLARAARNLFCSTTPLVTRPRWSKGTALCPHCWHALGPELQAHALRGLGGRLGSEIALHHATLADDWDDSVDGSIALAKLIEEVLPLRLQGEDRRKAVFKIAELQHRLIALDDGRPLPALGNISGGTSWSVRAAWADHLTNLIEQSCTALVKEAVR